jgi:hypothetical protein
MISSALLRSFWTLVSLASSVLILGMVVGLAAWSGINFAVGLYLFFSFGGTIGLFAGFLAAFSTKRLVSWITCVSALAVAGVSGFLGLGFLFYRPPGVPLNSPIFIGGLSVPLLLVYCVALVCCIIEAFLYFPRKIKTQDTAG